MAIFRAVLVVVFFVAACAPAPEPVGAPAEDGSIPENESISVNDTGHAALARLDPALLAAVREAAVAAQASRGVELKVTSGWRSAEYQQRLFDQAVERYGSEKEARRWVQPPDKSKHVTGQAVDVGPTNAADFLIQHGADYGLCQAYANEMWHFELLTSRGGECPQPVGDPAG
ncbi:M15 family metallopeptidase [Lentzea alba]|uniref:M15 family metallopeptidase n=1 Tax=Lentzea alba TaxID=2714351 RepID=UPI0039BF0252